MLRLILSTIKYLGTKQRTTYVSRYLKSQIGRFRSRCELSKIIRSVSSGDAVERVNRMNPGGEARAPSGGYEINSVYTREQDESEGIIVPRLGIGSV